MADPKTNSLAYAGTPAVRASTRIAGDRQDVAISPVTYGENHDICLPAENEEQARKLLREFALNLDVKANTEEAKQLQGLLKATGAGQFYILQINSAKARFTKVAEGVAAEVKEGGKYTPEMGKKLVKARQALTESLKDIFPAMTFYRSSPPLSTLESTAATEKMVEQLEALETLSGRPQNNLTRNITKRGQGALTYADEVPIKVDLQLAKKLKLIDSFIVVVDLAPEVSLLLTSNNEREQNAALVALSAKAAGVFVDRVTSEVAMNLCVGFGVMTGGWGFLMCGVAAIGTGIFAGLMTENYMKSKLTPIVVTDPPRLP